MSKKCLLFAFIAIWTLASYAQTDEIAGFMRSAAGVGYHSNYPPIEVLKSKIITSQHTSLSGENANLLNVKDGSITVSIQKHHINWPVKAAKYYFDTKYVLCVSIPTSYSVQWNQQLDEKYLPHLRLEPYARDCKGRLIDYHPEDQFYYADCSGLPGYIRDSDFGLCNRPYWYRIGQFSLIGDYGPYMTHWRDVSSLAYWGEIWQKEFDLEEGEYYYYYCWQPGMRGSAADKSIDLWIADPTNYYDSRVVVDVSYHAYIFFEYPEILDHKDTIMFFIPGTLKYLNKLYDNLTSIELNDIHLCHRDVDLEHDSLVNSILDDIENYQENFTVPTDYNKYDFSYEEYSTYIEKMLSIVPNNYYAYNDSAIPLSFLQCKRVAKICEKHAEIETSVYSYLNKFAAMGNADAQYDYAQFLCFRDKIGAEVFELYIKAAMNGNEKAIEKIKELILDEKISKDFVGSHFQEKYKSIIYGFSTETMDEYEKMRDFVKDNFSKFFQIQRKKNSEENYDSEGKYVRPEFQYLYETY